MADLESEFQATEEIALASQKALADRLLRQKGDDRSVIAKAIILAFIGMVSVVVLAVMLGTYYLGWEKLVGPGKFLMVILGSVMLPVVTLVIGYYFGNK
jgi:ABC-type glycerol-3-phosphate transport system permease component